MSPDGPPERRRVPRVLRRVFWVLLVGGITLGATSFAGESAAWQVTLSVFVGGITAAIQFLNDFEQRLVSVERAVGRHGAAMTERIAGRIEGISRAVNLVDQTSTRRDLLDFLDKALKIEQGASLRSRLAQREIARMSHFLEGLAAGHAAYRGEDHIWLLELTRAAQESIDATSLPTVDSGFWRSELGLHYLDCQRDAVARGVRIRRVFFLDSTDPVGENSALREVCQRHADAGIAVRVLDPTDVELIPTALQTDFIVFDGEISYSSEPTQRPRSEGRPVIVNTRLESRADLVAEQRRNFELFWEAARPLPLPDRPAA